MVISKWSVFSAAICSILAICVVAFVRVKSVQIQAANKAIHDWAIGEPKLLVTVGKNSCRFQNGVARFRDAKFGMEIVFTRRQWYSRFYNAKIEELRDCSVLPPHISECVVSDTDLQSLRDCNYLEVLPDEIPIENISVTKANSNSLEVHTQTEILFLQSDAKAPTVRFCRFDSTSNCIAIQFEPTILVFSPRGLLIALVSDQRNQQDKFKRRSLFQEEKSAQNVPPVW